MADLSWIDSLSKNVKGAFGLDPKQAAEGQLIQKRGDLYDAQTVTERYRSGSLLPAQKGVFDADAAHKTAQAGKVGAETKGIEIKNKGAQALSSLLADPANYVNTPDGRRVPNVQKIEAIMAASAAAGGEGGVKNLPSLIGGFNLQAAPLSPGANLAAGGANATAGAKMLEPIKLSPDQSLVPVDRLTGVPMPGGAGVPPPKAPESRILNLSPEQLAAAEIGTATMPAEGSNLSGLLSGVSTPATGGRPVLGPIEDITPPQTVFQAPTNKTQLAIAGGKNQTAVDIARSKNETTLTKADKDNAARIEAAVKAAQARGASAEEVARIRNAGKAAGAPDAAELLRRNKLEKEAVTALVQGFSAGQTVDPDKAQLLASAALKEFPGDSPAMAVQKFMAKEGIVPYDPWGTGNTGFKQGDKDYDFNALRNRVFGSPDQSSTLPNIVSGGAQAAGGGTTVIPQATVNSFLPTNLRDPRGQGVVIQPQAQPQPKAQPAPAPAQQQAAAQPSQPANLSTVLTGLEPGQGVLKRDAKPGFNVGGVTFSHGSGADVSSFKHGEVRLVTKDPNSPSVPAYFNADTGKFQSEEPPPQETYIGNIRAKSGYSLDEPGRLNDVFARAATNGYNSKEALMEVEAGSNGRFKIDVYKRLKGDEKSDYINREFGARLEEARQSYLGDPRIDQYASGRFDEIGIPSDAMRLAELLGINRAAFNIPQRGIAENYPFIGTIPAMKAHGEATAAMEKALPEFFRAVQEGRFDPKTMQISPERKNGPTGVFIDDGRSIGGTEVGSLSPHQVALVNRGISGAPRDATLAEAISERTRPGIVDRALQNLGIAGKNLKKSGENLGSAVSTGAGAVRDGVGAAAGAAKGGVESVAELLLMPSNGKPYTGDRSTEKGKDIPKKDKNPKANPFNLPKAKDR